MTRLMTGSTATMLLEWLISFIETLSASST
jgi:hypothetical protein